LRVECPKRKVPKFGQDVDLKRVAVVRQRGGLQIERWIPLIDPFGQRGLPGAGVNVGVVADRGLEQCLKPVDRREGREREGGCTFPGDRVVEVSSNGRRWNAGPGRYTHAHSSA